MSDLRDLKPGWKVWRFDQFAINVNDRVDDPSKAGVDRYVGLEHLDPDSLKIRRWGTPDQVEATKLRFRAGDIIFGRRRAYQRKLGLAEFDGICSAHAMVVRPRPDVVLPQFLPFFMQSDVFMERAIEISVGSLSPTINWKTLAIQGFALPQLEEQRRIVELLASYHDLIDELTTALGRAGRLLQSIKDYLASASLTGDPRIQCKLVDVLRASPESGCSAVPASEETGHYVLALSALSSEGYRPGELKPVAPTGKMLDAMLQKDDLLISRSNTIERVGFVGIFDEDRSDVSFPDTMMRLPVRPDIIEPRFLEALLQTSMSRRFITGIAAGTSASMKKINRQNLLNLPLSVPRLELQRELLRNLALPLEAARILEDRLRCTKQVQDDLKIQILDGQAI